MIKGSVAEMTPPNMALGASVVPASLHGEAMKCLPDGYNVSATSAELHKSVEKLTSDTSTCIPFAPRD